MVDTASIAVVSFIDVVHLSFSLPHTEGSQREVCDYKTLSLLDHLDSAILISVKIKFQAGFHVALC